jgi:hypothetical protein
VTSRGELVGINTMIISQTGGYAGIGFAIPSNLARRVMDELHQGAAGACAARSATCARHDFARAGARKPTWATRAACSSDKMSRRIRPTSTDAASCPRHHRRVNQTTITEQGQLQRLIAESNIGIDGDNRVIRNGQPGTFQIPVVRQSYAA